MFQVSILDIEKADLVFKGLAHCVVLPGREGELSILEFHQPVLSCLRQGVVTIKAEESVCIKIQEGIAGMSGDELIVLAKNPKINNAQI